MTEQEKQEVLQQMKEADKAYEKALAEEKESEQQPKRKAKIYIAGRVTGVKPEVYEK